MARSSSTTWIEGRINGSMDERLNGQWGVACVRESLVNMCKNLVSVFENEEVESL